MTRAEAITYIRDAVHRGTFPRVWVDTSTDHPSIVFFTDAATRATIAVDAATGKAIGMCGLISETLRDVVRIYRQDRVRSRVTPLRPVVKVARRPPCR